MERPGRWKDHLSGHGTHQELGQLWWAEGPCASPQNEGAVGDLLTRLSR